jgi:hypothetical protein
MEKPKSKKDVITPVNKFVKDQKKLITTLKDDLKKDINDIATNIKAKYTKPKKERTEQEKAATKAKRAETMEAKKKAKTEDKPKPTKMEFGTQTEKPTKMEFETQTEEPKKEESVSEIINNIKMNKYKDAELRKIAKRFDIPLSKKKGVFPNKTEIENMILAKLSK